MIRDFLVYLRIYVRMKMRNKRMTPSYVRFNSDDI